MNTDSTKSNKYPFFLHHFHIMAKVKAFPDPQISFLCILDRLAGATENGPRGEEASVSYRTAAAA